MMTDKQLIRNLQKDDKRSFDELFERYYDQCYMYVSALVKDVDATEDIIQNVFMKIWMGRMRLSASRPFKNYLFVAIRNESFTYLQKKGNQPKEALSAELHDTTQDVIENLVTREIEMIISAVIKRMPPQRQEVFVRSRMKGETVAEIAAGMGLSPRTVERHLYLALKDVRSEIYRNFQ